MDDNQGRLRWYARYEMNAQERAGDDCGKGEAEITTAAAATGDEEEGERKTEPEGKGGVAKRWPARKHLRQLQSIGALL